MGLLDLGGVAVCGPACGGRGRQGQRPPLTPGQRRRVRRRLVHPLDHWPGAGQVAGLVVLPAPLGRVMAISGVAPWHQGRIVLPVLGKVAATKYTNRVAVRLVSG